VHLQNVPRGKALSVCDAEMRAASLLWPILPPCASRIMRRSTQDTMSLRQIPCAARQLHFQSSIDGGKVYYVCHTRGVEWIWLSIPVPTIGREQIAVDIGSILSRLAAPKWHLPSPFLVHKDHRLSLLPIGRQFHVIPCTHPLRKRIHSHDDPTSGAGSACYKWEFNN
jgi:hypothetical protein